MGRYLWLEWVVIMLRIYGDISGKPRDTAMVAAAYLGAEYRWAAVDDDWRRALSDAKVNHFHATDFFNCGGAFKAWKRGSKRHLETARQFTAIAVNHGLLGSAYGVNVAAYNSIVRPVMMEYVPKRERILTPRLLCVQGCLASLAKVVAEFPMNRRERVAVIFESEPGIGEVTDYFNRCKHRKEPWTTSFISVTSTVKSVRPLQVADLLAYESWKRLTDIFNETGRDKRRSLQRMLEKESIEIKYLAEEELQIIAQALLRRHVDQSQA